MTNLYMDWHNHPKHTHVHWGVFIVVGLLVSNLIISEINKTYSLDFSVQTTLAATKTILTQNDITYVGTMRMPTSIDTGWSDPIITGRMVNGQVRLFVYGRGGVFELADTGVYDKNYLTAPRMNLVTKWGDVYNGKAISFLANGSQATFDLARKGSLFWNEKEQKLYWTFYDNYNVTGRPDWNLGFSTLDNPSTGAFTSYGPFRTKATDSTGVKYGAWRCIFLWQNPLDDSMMCGSTIQSGIAGSVMGPSMFGGLAWPTTSTPSGFGAPDLNLPDRYLMYYYMNYINNAGSVGSNPIRSARRSFKPYIFETFPNSQGSTEVNPALYGGVGSWTQRDVWKGGTWLELNSKRGVLFATSLAGSTIQNPNDCNAGHVWYSNVGGGTLQCSHGCMEQGGSTGPTVTAYFPAIQIYNPDDLTAVKNGTKVDYTPDPVATIDLRDLGAKFTVPGNSTDAIGGFYFDPVRNYLFVAAPGADDKPTFGFPPWTLIHVFHVNDGTSPTPTPTPVPAPVPAPAPTPTPTPTPVGAPPVIVTPTAGSYLNSNQVTVTSTFPSGTLNLAYQLWNGNTKVWERIRPYNTTIPAGQTTWTDQVAMSPSFVAAGAYDLVAQAQGGPANGLSSTKVRVNVGPASTPTPTPITLSGDINKDGVVNSLDWSIMSSKWFTTDSASDLNKDGIVNSIDFSIMNNNWLKVAS